MFCIPFHAFFFFSLKESSERFVILLKYQSGTNINHQSHLNLFFSFFFFLLSFFPFVKWEKAK